MIKKVCLAKELFDEKVIMNSGQVFRMFFDENEEVYKAYSGENQVSFFRCDDSTVSFECEDGQWDFWESYFDFKTDYNSFNQAVKKSDDMFLKKALKSASGMRILKQDLWETFISYMISQNNNIPKIKKSINILCERYSDGYAFPSADVLSEVSLEELKEGTMLGYRAEYILEFSKLVSRGAVDIDAMAKLDGHLAKQSLLSIKGIGEKVANCILLYGMHKMDSYPIDTWMKKIIEEDYGYLSKDEYMKYINENYYGFQGYIQQLQFYFKRQNI